MATDTTTPPLTVHAAERDAAHLAEVHEAEALVAEVERTREELRGSARRAVGIDATTAVPRLRDTLRTHRITLYPLVAIGVFGTVDVFFSYGFSVLAPEISRSLGISRSAVGGILGLKTLALALAPLPVAALVQRRPRRALLTILMGIAWSVTSIVAGFVSSTVGLIAVLLVDGVTTGSITALHLPLLSDSYPPEARSRAFGAYGAASAVGQVVAPLLVAGLTAALGFSWRGVFVVLGVTSLAAALLSLRLRDPGFGRFDTEEIRRQVQEHGGAAAGVAADLSGDDVSLGFFEIVRRLFLIPTVRRLLAAFSVIGILLIPYQTFLFFFLEERWNLGPGGRGVFFAATAAASIVVLPFFARYFEGRFRKDPGSLLRIPPLLLIVGVGFIVLGGLAPTFPLMIVAFILAGIAVSALAPALNIITLSVVPAQMRPHAAALIGIFTGGVGGIAGAVFLGSVDRRFGVAGSLVSIAIPAVIGALVLRSTSRLVNGDMDRMIDGIIEEEEVRRLSSSGAHLPMLACRGVDFSYGQLQVLFDVDFTVDDGEMVALLGTNGAGKSTLLRVISGLGLPSKGTVRYRGQDITYIDAERRLRLGITQIPGGKSVFGPLTVTENLRLFGYTLGQDRKAVDAAIELSFDAFPRLAERRNQTASTMSGGEQQMLGLSKALILRPRLLVIDELSLGLAPIIVGQLLEMVRRINADGTAVVLVEQSVNIALSLVDHAYFMEKGQIRFDGPAADLLGRDDLLRAVFLEGAKGAEPVDAPDRTVSA